MLRFKGNYVMVDTIGPFLNPGQYRKFEELKQAGREEEALAYGGLCLAKSRAKANKKVIKELLARDKKAKKKWPVR